MIKRIYLIIICQFLCAGLLNAGAFTAKPPNALSAGMGYSAAAARGELSSLEHNPAALSGVEGIRLLFSYRDFYSLNLLGHSSAALAVPAAPGRALGISFNRIATSASVDFIDYSEEVFTLGYASDVESVRGLSAGVSFSFYRAVSVENASGYGFSAGGLWSPPGAEGLSLGAALRNLNNPRIEWTSGAADRLVPSGSVSASYRHSSGLSGAVSYDGLASAGIQYELPGGALVHRAGYRALEEYSGEVSAGLSAYYRRFRLDYAAQRHAALGFTHLFSVNVYVERMLR